MTGQLSFVEGAHLATALLRAVGLNTADAESAAGAIVLADAWGVSSHGLMRLPYYLERLTGGGMAADAALTPVTDTGPLVVYDGNGGLGHPQLLAAADLASARCGPHGIAAVAIANSSHCGCLGVYTLPPLRRGHLGLVFTNGPAAMAPWGGHAPVLSTSPLAAGIPVSGHPIIVDMATTAVARGAIAARVQRGEPLEPGWAVDAAGEPTLDAQAALTGMLAPLGGAKGFALALIVEALTGGLIGPALSTEVADMFDPGQADRPQRIAHLAVAIDPSLVDPSGGSAERLTALAASVVGAGGRLPGARRPMPEDLDPNLPLAVAPAVLDELSAWRTRLGV